jgi:hypothetical protein
MTTGFQLEDKLKNLKGFRGIFSRDTLPILKPGQSLIFNLSKLKDPGTHWISIYFNPNGNIFYLDPIGLPAPPEALKMMKRWGGKIFWNNVSYQYNRSEDCGQFCVYFLEHLNFKSLDDPFPRLSKTDEKKNDKIVEKNFE